MLMLIVTEDKQGLVWDSQDQDTGWGVRGIRTCISIRKNEGGILILRKCMYVPVFGEESYTHACDSENKNGKG